MRIFSSLLLFLIFISATCAQEIKIKPLNKKKWQELVKEVNSKRYDRAQKQSQSDSEAENEYREKESEDYNTSNESGTNEEGIYNNNDSKDDDLFFDESKDKDPKEGDRLDPKYEDDESGNGNGDGGPNDSNRDKSDRELYYEKDRPESPSGSRSGSSQSSGGSSAGGGDSTWLLIVMIAILAAAVVYMIVVSFSEKNKKVNIVAVDESRFENLTITKSELELALEAALKDKNYREAVRIYFIAVIKEMKDRSWIKWEKKKTNYHYINEITGRQQQPDFITATRAFEIVWYGNRTLAENEYNQIEPLFKKLIKSIHS